MAPCAGRPSPSCRARCSRRRWSRSTPSSDRLATSTSSNCAPRPASCASCRPCSDPSPSAPRPPGSQRWMRCAICAARTGAARLLGTARLRAEWLEAAGQSRRRRRGQPRLPALPAGRHAGRDPPARPVRVTQPALRRPADRPAGWFGLGGSAAVHLPHPRASRPTRPAEVARLAERLDAAYQRHRGEPAQERQPCRWTAASWSCPPSTSWRSRPAWSRSRRPSPRACRGWTCPSCCWRCTLAPALPTGSPMPARAAHGPAASPPASAPCCWPKRATPGSSR